MKCATGRFIVRPPKAVYAAAPVATWHTHSAAYARCGLK